MKKNYWILFAIFTTLLCGCSKDEHVVPDFSGTWIETTNRQDTIQFLNLNSDKVFILGRGTETRNGYILPKSGAGIYFYKLKQDSISVQSVLSSCMCYPTYYFNVNSSLSSFQVGNFFDPTQDPAHLLTFIKIKN